MKKSLITCGGGEISSYRSTLTRRGADGDVVQTTRGARVARALLGARRGGQATLAGVTNLLLPSAHHSGQSWHRTFQKDGYVD